MGPAEPAPYEKGPAEPAPYEKGPAEAFRMKWDRLNTRMHKDPARLPGKKVL